jgi:hypothetical protein
VLSLVTHAVYPQFQLTRIIHQFLHLCLAQASGVALVHEPQLLNALVHRSRYLLELHLETLA